MPTFAPLVWDQTGERWYELGVSKCVLYVQSDSGTYPKGIAWNGVTSISESPSGADATDLWADNIKYAVLRAVETFGGTIEAYTYPDEWAECDGSVTLANGMKIGQQARKAFGLSYVSKIGNDTQQDTDDGELIHLVYGATASPSERQYQTINDSPDAIQFSWEFQTVPVPYVGYKDVSTIVIDTRKTTSTGLAALKAAIWGTDAADAYLPLPAQVATLLATT